ncbi:DMT family transporter [Geitlerinema sp. PCC 9228]|jgi:drug/metabolite transporter (DMT)-like permease|uniref:DMT family transporter n=1 Tax=Geitlerinema sp. PCC 9228 TaxID=111611 RepID=UPI0008F9920D|nr:DMT family transporter [Geitlerinema sp. PCC 9228]
MVDFQGELAALSAAAFWAIASLVYARLGQQIAPLLLNLYKGLVAIALLLFTLMLRGVPFWDLSPFPFLWLSLSGVVGIGLGDTAFFNALNALGPRRALLLETLAPPLSAILAFIFLGERLNIRTWTGIFLTILGVAWVISERTPSSHQAPHRWRWGIGYGLLATVAQAVGAVLSRMALNETAVSPLVSASIRLVAGVLTILPLLWLARPPSHLLWKPLQSVKAGLAVVLAAFFSTYLGIWLQQTSLKLAPAGIAQTLSATSPLFVLPLAAWMGDRVSLRAILGALVAIAGIGLLFVSRSG